MIQVIDLFSGIGGFSLAALRCGWRTVQFCEINKHCQERLAKNFPGVPIHADIHTLDYDTIRTGGWNPAAPTLVCGGFPCQPYSVAGKRRGAADDRAVWPEMLRIIQAVRPAWVVGENVAGFVNLGLDSCLADLESAGYACQAFVIPACAVDAPHRRDRVWIVGNAEHPGQPAGQITGGGGERAAGAPRQNVPDESTGSGYVGPEAIQNPHRIRRGSDVRQGEPDAGGQRKLGAGDYERVHSGPGVVPDTDGESGQKQCQPFTVQSERATPGLYSRWPPEPPVGRVVNGLPGRVDRIAALGNAIVPQVAYQIFSAINQIEGL